MVTNLTGNLQQVRSRGLMVRRQISALKIACSSRAVIDRFNFFFPIFFGFEQPVNRIQASLLLELCTATPAPGHLRL